MGGFRPSTGFVLVFTALFGWFARVGAAVEIYATPHNAAVSSYEEYTAGVTLFNQGNEFHKNNQLDQAMVYYRKSVLHYPLLGEAYLNMGNILKGVEAYRIYEKAVEVSGPNSLAPNKPLYANALANMGHYLVELQSKGAEAEFKTIEKAIEMYIEALRWQPENDNVWYNLGIAYEKQGFRQDAFEAYRKTLALEPLHVGANLNIGNLMMYGGYHNLSLFYHERALSSPGLTEWYKIGTMNNMGETYRFLNDVKSSLAMNRRALAVSPNDEMTLFNIYKAKRTLCDWENIREEIDFLIKLTNDQLSTGPNCTMLPYDASLLPISKKFLLKVATANTHRYRKLQFVPRDSTNDHFVGKIVQYPNGEEGRFRLVVGYTGYDFNNHPMGHLTCGVLELHDRNHIGVNCYPYGNDDKTLQRLRIIKACDVFKNTTMLADYKIAHTMSDDGVHISVDLMAHTRGTRLGVAAYHPGAILVNYLGYPGTIGTYRYADYIIVDRNIVVPETAKNEVSEKVVYLPHHYQANDFLLHVDFCGGPSTKLLNSATNQRLLDPAVEKDCAKENVAAKREEEGIPGDASVVMCNFNTIDKMEQDVFAIWMSILRRVPGGVLWLLAPKGKTGDEVRLNFFKEATHFGVDPRRLIIARRVSKFDHLDRFRYCDLFLDTFIYGAHSTASDALWTFTPIVTFEGELFQSRVAADLIFAIGLDELVTHSRRDFEDVSVALANNPAKLTALRDKLIANALPWPLFDTFRMTDNLERSYKAMWEVRETFKMDPTNLVIAPASPYKMSPLHVLEQRDAVQVKAAINLQSSGNLTQAGNIYRRLLAVDPGSSNYWHLFGLTRHAQGYHQAGVNFVKYAVALEGDNFIAMYHQNLAELCRSIEDLQCAVKHLELTWKNQEVSLETTQNIFDTLIRLRESATVVQFFEAYGTPLMIKENIGRGSEHIVTEILTLVAIAYAESVNLEANGVPDICFELLAKAIEISPNVPRPRQKLAIFFDLRNQFNTAFRIYTHMMKLQNKMDLLSMNAAQRNVQEQVYLARKMSRMQGKKILIIYCNEYDQTWWPNWGPTSMDTGGAGGSEEAVIFLSKEMHKVYGYHVEVYGDPLPEFWGQRKDTGVWWLPLKSYDAYLQDSSLVPDIFVSWRYHISTAYGENAKQQYIWLQDISKRYKVAFTDEYIDSVSGVFTLSQFHGREALSDYALKKTFVTPNALDPKYFYNGPNENNRFIYASAPNRGLSIVLVGWAQIKRAIPSAILEVYYGFSDAFLKFGQTSIPNFPSWLQKMKELLKQDGIIYHGMADHHTLGKGYARSGFYLYPTSYPETGCVALMKAQALGAIPITSQHDDSTLPELTSEFDLGPPMTEARKARRIDEVVGWQQEWVDSVVKAATMDERKIAEHRARMITKSRKRFLWSTVAGLWDDAFSRDVDYKSKNWEDVFPAAVSFTP